MNRAYSVIDFRAVDDEKRIIEGIATTEDMALDGLILESHGIEFKLPIPFLLHHDPRRPIGNVIEAKRIPNGIWVRIQIAPQGTAEYIDEAWRTIKAGIVRGLSITWKTLKRVGNRITSAIWIELSAVSTPADMNASITSVRSADEAILAALGTKTRNIVRLTPLNSPGVSGQTKGIPMKQTIREQIAAAEAKLAANETRQNEIAERCSTTGETRTEEEVTECETFEREASTLTDHIKFLKQRETQMIARATPVSAPALGVEPQAQGLQIRRHEPITVKRNDPPGIAVARMAIALHNAKGIKPLAAQMAREHWPDNPEVEMLLKMQMRAGVEAGDTTTSGWASQLVPSATQAAGEYLEMLRAATILGRIPGVRNVPFNIAIPIQSGTGTYGWVAEAAGKPVSSLTFTSVTLRWAKCAGIIVITQELARFSNPSAELIIRDEMVQGATRFIDAQFVGSAAEVSNVSPAGILNGISATAVTAGTAAAFRTDMNNMLNNFAANNVPLSGIVLLMSSTQALALSLIVTDLGVPLFPNINQSGGSVLGFPVIVSEAVGTKIIALYTPNIFVANGDGINIDVSTEASVEMETTPAVGEQSPLTAVSNIKSFWQNNLVGFRVEQFITWKAGRTAAVEYLSPVAYVP